VLFEASITFCTRFKQLRPTRPLPRVRKNPRSKPNPSALAPKFLGNQLSAYNRLDPFPAHVTRDLTYAELFQFTTGTAGIYGTQQSMRMNSIFDPNYTGTGHQPYGRDTMNTLYSRYRVDRCSFELWFTTPGAGNDILCTCSVAAGTSASLTGLAPDRPLEWPFAQFGQLSSSGSRLCVLRGTFNLEDVLGVSQAKYRSEENYCALMSADPAQDILLTFSVASFSASGGEATSVMCRLVYHTTLYERLTLALS